MYKTLHHQLKLDQVFWIEISCSLIFQIKTYPISDSLRTRCKSKVNWTISLASFLQGLISSQNIKTSHIFSRTFLIKLFTAALLFLCDRIRLFKKMSAWNWKQLMNKFSFTRGQRVNEWIFTWKANWWGVLARFLMNVPHMISNIDLLMSSKRSEKSKHLDSENCTPPWFKIVPFGETSRGI